MKKAIHGALVILAALCVLPAAYGQSDATSTQDAEQRFNIEMTAALNNEPEAQFKVAEMYEKGLGTPQNFRMAHLWYLKSANQGYEPAVKKLINWDEAKLQAQQRDRAEEQKRRQAEADAAAAKAARDQAAKSAASAPLAAKESAPERPKNTPPEPAAKSADKDTAEFRADPCKTPTAKFTSVCQ